LWKQRVDWTWSAILVDIWWRRLRCVLFRFFSGALDDVGLLFGLFLRWSFGGWLGFGLRIRCRFRFGFRFGLRFRIRFRRRFGFRFRCRFGRRLGFRRRFRFRFKYGFGWLL
jgi:hypothetical protein